MKSYGYFYVLNHIALAVDTQDQTAGFKSLVELDMFNRAGILVMPDAEPRARQIVHDLSAALYPKSADTVPTVEQRMMLVRVLHDSELTRIFGTMRFFSPFAFTKEDLTTRFGFFEDGERLIMPYFIRHLILQDQAVFCEGKLTSFSYAMSHGEVDKQAITYGLLPATAYGKNNIPEQYRHLPLF